ncbi:hypothetical protein HDU88_007857 [Geranomyces variabilis]|nr:hypothetical protein HDU88_007857 [Geranomyces variabilis]
MYSPAASEPTKDNGDMKVSDLAETTVGFSSDRPAWRRFKVPLLVLAPAIVFVSLCAVVIPVVTSLLITSKSVTEDLSRTYLDSIMQSTRQKVIKSLDPQRNALGALGRLPETSATMSNQFNMISQKPTWQLMANIMRAYGLDGIQCYTASFVPSIGSSAPIRFNTTLVTYLTASRSFIPPTTDIAIAVEDLSVPGSASQYPINQTTLELLNGTTPQLTAYPWDMTFSPAVIELLQPVPRREPFFGQTFNQQKLRGASISQVYTSYTNSSLNYACGASIIVDTAWVNLLIEAAGAGTSNVLLLLDINAKMDFISSSNRPSTYDQILSGKVSAETLSQSIRAAVLQRFGDYKGFAARQDDKPFQSIIEGAAWILNVGSVEMTTYSSDNLVLVVATPRAAIFAKIDAAQVRSVAIAVGLSVAIAVLMAVLFALIVNPLRHLARAMAMLTQMDFAALDNGKILEETSHISEIRNVQVTFTTMVRAFAGGIKKNRELQQKPGAAIKRSADRKDSTQN